jgi:phospholipid-transporting ATPase
MYRGSDDDDAIPQHRIIYINDSIKNAQQKFLHNGITTGKYQVYNFLFKFLKEQFSKYANLFFLFVAIIQVREANSSKSEIYRLPTNLVLLFH